MNTPTPLPNPDFSKLIELAQQHAAEAPDATEEEIAGWDEVIYDAAMEAIYGPDFFDWLNEQPWAK